MNKFIISESEKQRILEMHQNATSRQYLMEDQSKDVVYTTITLYYDLLPNKVKKRVGYMSFSTNFSTYKTEDIQTIKSFDLGGTVLSPITQKMSPEKVITGTLPHNKSLDSLIGKGASTSTANTLIPTIKTQDGKVVTSNTSLSTIVTVVEQQRQTPTQKESDLRRIVKNVMNERRYLMEGEDTSKLEPAITNWINAMNAVYGTQMKLGKSGTNVNITGGVRDILLYALPLTFPDDKAKIYPRITNGFKTIKSDMAGQDPNKKLLFMTCIPRLASSGGKVPQGCETVMKDPSIITKANAMNTAYDNLVRLVTPAQ